MRNMIAVDAKVRRFRIENLSVEVHPSRESLGAAAALAAAEAMKQLGASLESAREEIRGSRQVPPLDLVGWGNARDQVARTPRPRTRLKSLAKAFGLFRRLVKTTLPTSL